MRSAGAFRCSRRPAAAGTGLTMRRLADIVIGLVALGVFTPVIMLASVVVAVDLGRPVLFRQTRSGLRGQPFRMTKLRSMTDTRGPDGALLADARRITPFGRFLRRSRIDELPGLWHLVTGEMSLIGPRPLLPHTVAALGEAGVRRGAVRPGLTGWAQVNGNALLTDEQKLALDLWYIERASLRLDLVILLRTLLVVVGGERIDDHQLGRAYAGRDRRGG